MQRHATDIFLFGFMGVFNAKVRFSQISKPLQPVKQRKEKKEKGVITIQGNFPTRQKKHYSSIVQREAGAGIFLQTKCLHPLGREMKLCKLKVKLHIQI